VHRQEQGASAIRVRDKGQCRPDRSSFERRQVRDHVAALPGNPYDGHTLATVIPAMEDMIGNTIERLLADAGYRGGWSTAGHAARAGTNTSGAGGLYPSDA
jgi:hypothetical protein